MDQNISAWPAAHDKDQIPCAVWNSAKQVIDKKILFYNGTLLVLDDLKRWRECLVGGRISL
ncbi:hypothetical protein D0851_01230 [Marinobacter sp. Arc7-DN-1]|nr:hypothetical protein D0851_01230 [Marinobacter sp. Arc7-DN-1]